MSEAYDMLAHKEAEDVYLTEMPEAEENNDDVELAFDKFMKYRDDILKSLEEARASKVIGKSFNAKLTLTLDKEAKAVFDKLGDNIAQLLIVSQLELIEGEAFNVKVEVANGSTCERCWMIVPSINENGLCPRCQKIIDNK